MAEDKKIKKHTIDFQIGQIWYDSYLSDHYVVLSIDDYKLEVYWMSYGIKTYTTFFECKDDVFIRYISPLEKELL